MKNLIQAEALKMRHTLCKKMVWGIPLLLLLSDMVLSMGMTNVYAESVWNSWYTLLLPGTLAIIIYLNISKERKIHYYYQTAFAAGKKKTMFVKILYFAGLLFLSNVVIFAGASAGGAVFTTSVPLWGAVVSVPLLTAVYLWLIPVALFLSIRFGMIADILVCVMLVMGGTVFAVSEKAYLFVGSIPMRVVCPFLRVLPNGLCAEAGNPMLDMAKVVPETALALVWFVVLTILFLVWFDRKEVK